MDYFTKKNLIIGAVVLVAVVIIIIIIVMVKKEKFVLNGNKMVASSGVGAPPLPTPLTYLTADTNGNLSTSADGSFDKINATGSVYLNGYPGNVGDVIVSNGPTTPPVWAPPLTGSIKDGYQIFPGGLIIQWGSNPGIASGESADFPIPFPNACLSFVCVASEWTQCVTFGAARDKTKFYTFANFANNANLWGPITTNWIAIGY